VKKYGPHAANPEVDFDIHDFKDMGFKTGVEKFARIVG